MQDPNLSNITRGTRHGTGNSGQQSRHRHRRLRLTEAFRKPRTISSLNPLAQSFNWRQYLLGQIIVVICFPGRGMRSGLEINVSGENAKRKTRHRTYLAVAISLPYFIRVPSFVGLTGLGRFATGSQTKYVRYDISPAGCTSLGFHPQRNLNVGLAFCIWVILRILSQALRRSSGVSQRACRLFRSGLGAVHTLKIIKSSSFIRPALMFSPTERRYSWICSTTTSVISPDRIWSSTYL